MTTTGTNTATYRLDGPTCEEQDAAEGAAHNPAACEIRPDTDRDGHPTGFLWCGAHGHCRGTHTPPRAPVDDDLEPVKARLFAAQLAEHDAAKEPKP